VAIDFDPFLHPRWCQNHRAELFDSVINHPGVISGVHTQTHTNAPDGENFNQWAIDDASGQMRMRLLAGYTASEIGLGHLIQQSASSAQRNAGRGVAGHGEAQASRPPPKAGPACAQAKACSSAPPAPPAAPAATAVPSPPKWTPKNFTTAVKAQVKTMPWTADALLKVNQLKASKQTKAGFAKGEEFENEAHAGKRPSIQMKHVLAVADFEAGNFFSARPKVDAQGF
jgi:hypothetical protein